MKEQQARHEALLSALENLLTTEQGVYYNLKKQNNKISESQISKITPEILHDLLDCSC